MAKLDTYFGLGNYAHCETNTVGAVLIERLGEDSLLEAISHAALMIHLSISDAYLDLIR